MATDHASTREGDVEPDVDTVSSIVQVYRRLKAAGDRIDQMAGVLIEALAAQPADAEAFVDG